MKRRRRPGHYLWRHSNRNAASADTETAPKLLILL